MEFDINNPTYLPQWKKENKENVSIKKICIVVTCYCMSNITTTNIYTSIEIATMTDSLNDTQTVMLCKSQYRQVHHLLHNNNDMHIRIKCYTCNANIKYDKAWQCPDPKAITEH